MGQLIKMSVSLGPKLRKIWSPLMLCYVMIKDKW